MVPRLTPLRRDNSFSPGIFEPTGHSPDEMFRRNWSATWRASGSWRTSVGSIGSLISYASASPSVRFFGVDVIQILARWSRPTWGESLVQRRLRDRKVQTWDLVAGSAAANGRDLRRAATAIVMLVVVWMLALFVAGARSD
jgi:hypothetical protein